MPIRCEREGTAAVDSTPEPVASGRYRFSAFEVNLHDGELRKSGLRIKAQDQPLQVLSILLSRPGEIVTREEFRTLLWPAHTFVDFEHGLNSAIKRLRHLLDDDPNHPRYIETLPRHGYRFIADVSAVKPPQHEGWSGVERRRFPANATTLPTSEPLRTHLPPASPAQFPAASRLRRRMWIAVTALLVLMALLLGVQKWQQRHVQLLLHRKTMLAVLPLADLAGDSSQHALAEGMTEELITQLGKADPEQLGVIAHSSVKQYRNTSKPVSLIGKELRVDYVLEGSARAEGSHVRISVQLIKVSDQTHLWAEEYDSTLNDRLGLQATVAGNVVRGILGTLPKGHPPGKTPINSAKPSP